MAPLPPAIFNKHLYTRILHTWFSTLPAGAIVPDKPTLTRWFGLGDAASKEAFDAECRTTALAALDALGPSARPLPAFTTFAEDAKRAADMAAALVDAVAQAQGPGERDAAALGMVLLLDQFSRNVFRDERAGVVYAHYDRLARAFLARILAPQTPVSGADVSAAYRADPARRLWFYMPLEHSEDVGDHERFAELMGDVRRQGGEQGEQFLGQQDGFENEHVVLLRRFGRYPHRNRVLGRESTAEEREYLKGAGEVFGVKAGEPEAR